MRAPPAAVNTTSGVRRATAVSQARMKASPAPMPSEPPMKAKSCTSTVVSTPRIEPTPMAMASSRPVFLRAAVRRLE